MIEEVPQQPKKRSHASIEASIQCSCVVWFNNTYPQYRGLFFCVPNENARSADLAHKDARIIGAMRRSMGVVSGVSDTLLLLPRKGYHAACIEFKTETGKQSERQVQWQTLVESKGYYYCIIRSLEDFKREVSAYLN